MAASQTPPPHVNPAAAASQTPPQPIQSSQPHRPLQREGAVVFLLAAEQAMEDTMMRSSLTPEPVLGKRGRQADSLTDGNDTEPDNGLPSTPSISNVAAATLWYVSKKKLRPEQRDEVDAFLLVSTPLTYILGSCLNIDQDTVLG